MDVSGGENIGLRREQEASVRLYQDLQPLLVDPTLLRSFGLGQVDLAFFQREKIVIVEVKGRAHPNNKQYMRIYRTAHWLGELFKCSVKVETYMLSWPVPKVNTGKNNARQEEQRFLT